MAAWPVRTVGDRLNRIGALAALVEGVAIALDPGATRHDYTLDAEFYRGLGAVANVIREDYDAIQLSMGSETLDQPSPAVLYSERGR